MEIEQGLMAQTHGPSMGLRFVEREVSPGKTVRILQQLFMPRDWTRYEEEWRDVPLALPEPPKLEGHNDTLDLWHMRDDPDRQD